MSDRMRRNVTLVCAAVLLAAASPVAAQTVGAPPQEALNSITVEELMGMLKFYSSDWMQGRATGEPGYDMATDYLAASLAASGVRPALPGGYFQEIDMVKYGLSEDFGFSLMRGGSSMGTFEGGTHFNLSSGYADWKLEGDLVFAGYGISAPDNGWDDYAGLDVAGKVVVAVDLYPGFGQEQTPFGTPQEASRAVRGRTATAQEKGALGLIIVPNPLAPERTRIRSLEQMMTVSRRPELLERVSQETYPVITVNGEVASRIFAEGELQRVVDRMQSSGRSQRLNLTGLTVRAHASMNRVPVPTRNVLAMVEGTDLKDEYVVLGAHADHTGMRGDEVMNGADDDGSGSVLLLELAEAFTNAGQRPRRTVIFGWWCGEEIGLLGAWHYTRHPIGSLEKTVGLIQMDMVGRNEEYDPRKSRGLPEETAEQNANAVNCIGYSYSSDMQALISRANEPVGLEVKFRYDAGTQNLLRRSDHWNFLQMGVPVAFLFTGIHPDYHEPTDTWDKINYPKMARIGQMAFRAAWELANTDNPPKLNPGVDIGR